VNIEPVKAMNDHRRGKTELLSLPFLLRNAGRTPGNGVEMVGSVMNEEREE
jgi:hypothetical protein